MIKSAPNINLLWASILIEELTRHNITQFFISPGSRSSPLTTAAARHQKTESIVHFDERGAAFAAVGYARASHRPAALVCTSGTAVANYLPAVVEASMDRLPLVLLTADRPPELQTCDANQTIAQPGIFSHFVRYELNLPCPDIAMSANALLSTVDAAVYAALKSPRGPVHINCPFREPLDPVHDQRDYRPYLARVEDWLSSGVPWSRALHTPLGCATSDIHVLAEYIRESENGIVVVGQLESESDCDAALALSERIGWPLLPDIQSGLRLGLTHPNVISNYDCMLLLPGQSEKLLPDTVLHVGGRVTSKRLLRWLDQVRAARYVAIDGVVREFDPNHQVTLRLPVAVSAVTDELTKHFTSSPLTQNLAAWQKWSDTVDRTTGSIVGGTTLHEPSVAHLLSQLLSNRHALWLASSLPIRLMDMYAANSGAAVPVGANRGASGIDGTIAAAVGFAHGLRRPLTVLIGDLAFLHDLNSLALVRASQQPITIVLLNNNGGGIFGLLPIAEYDDVFERYFTTPHGLTFELAAAQFGIEYTQVRTLDEFQIAYIAGRDSGHSSVIEVMVNREATIEVIRSIERSVRNLTVD